MYGPHFTMLLILCCWCFKTGIHFCESLSVGVELYGPLPEIKDSSIGTIILFF